MWILIFMVMWNEMLIVCIFCRLLLNFEYCEGKLVVVWEILVEGEKMKENFVCLVSLCLFGYLVKEIWGDGVRVVKCGLWKGW